MATAGRRDTLRNLGTAIAIAKASVSATKPARSRRLTALEFPTGAQEYPRERVSSMCMKCRRKSAVVNPDNCQASGDASATWRVGTLFARRAICG